MIRQTSLALATVLLMAGMAAASAASASPSLNLTIKQRNIARSDLQSGATGQKAPSSFRGSVGA
jgi:hypothetical protein